MDKGDIAEVVAKWAESEPQVTKAYMFGSWVKGTVHDGSDIDIAVKLEGLRGDSFAGAGQQWDKDDLVERLQLLLPFPLQLEWYDPAYTPKMTGYLEDASFVVYDADAVG